MDLSSIPVLDTPRMSLRALTASDATALYRLRSDPRVMHYIPKPLFERTAEADALVKEFQQSFDKHESVLWGITMKGSVETLGIIGFWRIIAEHHRAELGYFLAPELWGRGLMTEAVAAALEYGFRHMGLHSVEASTHPQNTGSIRVLERNSFVREGYFTGNIRVNGEFVDTVVYSRLDPPHAHAD